MKYYTYVLLCSDGSLYTGFTNDIENRLEAHNSGKGAKYTRGRLPVRVMYKETFNDESSARKREFEIKKWDRKKKIRDLGLDI